MTSLVGALPGMPVDADGPVFAEPWRAQAFAMAVGLHQKGLFTWVEWAQALSTRIAAAQAAGDADLGDTYRHHWLGALESLVAAKGASTMDELELYQRAWDHAADRTPHGQPIVLAQGDFTGSPTIPPSPRKGQGGTHHRRD
jgi:nitrile hydratase accessory protein